MKNEMSINSEFYITKYRDQNDYYNIYIKNGSKQFGTTVLNLNSKTYYCRRKTILRGYDL